MRSKMDEPTAKDFLEKLRALCEEFEVIIEGATVFDAGGHIDDAGDEVTLAGRHLIATSKGASYLMVGRTRSDAIVVSTSKAT